MSNQTRENLTVDDLIDPDVLAEVTSALQGEAVTGATDHEPIGEMEDETAAEGVVEVGAQFDSLAPRSSGDGATTSVGEPKTPPPRVASKTATPPPRVASQTATPPSPGLLADDLADLDDLEEVEAVSLDEGAPRPSQAPATDDLVVTGGPAAQPKTSAPPPLEALQPLGTTIEVPDELGDTEAGQVALGKFSALKVLFGCALSNSNGIARYKDDEGTLKLYYREGIVTEARSTVARLSPQAWLVNKGTVDAAQIEHAQALASSLDADPLDALLNVDGVDSAALGHALTEWTKAVLAEVARRAEGVCHFQAGPVRSPRVALGLTRFGSLNEAIHDGFTEELLLERLQRISSRSLLPRKIGDTGFEDLDLYDEEKAVIASLDDVKSLDDLLITAGGDLGKRMAALRAVYLGLEAELLRIGHGPAGRAQMIEAKRLESELVELRRKKNYFEVMGVAADASDNDVRNRYLELKRQYSAEGTGREIPELAEARKSLLEVVEKAYRALATREKREKGATAVARIVAPVRAPSVAPPAKLQSSIELFQEAESAGRKGNFGLAVQKIEAAIESRPDKLDYKMYLEYYKVLQDKYDRRGNAEAAIKTIEGMLNEDEPIVDAHLIMGRLFKFARRKSDALYEFERALELDPDNQEALTEVRIGTNAATSQAKAPSRASSAISFLKKKLTGEEDEPKKKKKRKSMAELEARQKKK